MHPVCACIGDMCPQLHRTYSSFQRRVTSVHGIKRGRLVAFCKVLFFPYFHFRCNPGCSFCSFLSNSKSSCRVWNCLLCVYCPSPHWIKLWVRNSLFLTHFMTTKTCDDWNTNWKFTFGFTSQVDKSFAAIFNKRHGIPALQHLHRVRSWSESCKIYFWILRVTHIY